MSPAPATAVSRPLGPPPRAVSADAIYWKNEAQKAIKEREDIKKSLVSADGPASFWRSQAKDLSKKLADAQTRVDGLRRGEREQRDLAITFSEQLDTQKRHVVTLKQQLWAIWSGLDDDSPVKQPLWSVWGAL